MFYRTSRGIPYPIRPPARAILRSLIPIDQAYPFVNIAGHAWKALPNTHRQTDTMFGNLMPITKQSMFSDKHVRQEVFMAIKELLKEELANSLRMERDYRRALAKLPRGCLVKKIIRGRAYYYPWHS